jgi:hypothetical protein
MHSHYRAFQYHWSQRPKSPDGNIDGKPFFITPCMVDKYRNTPIWYNFNPENIKGISSLSYMPDTLTRNRIWQESEKFMKMFTTEDEFNYPIIRMFDNEMAVDVYELLDEHYKLVKPNKHPWLNIGAGSNAVLVDRVLSCFDIKRVIHVECQKSHFKTYVTESVTRKRMADPLDFYQKSIEHMDIGDIPKLGGILLMNPSGDIGRSARMINEIAKARLSKEGAIAVACEKEDVGKIIPAIENFGKSFEYVSSDKKFYYIFS